MYFLKFGGKKRSRGHVACSPSARGGLPVWGLSGRGPLGELPGGALSARPRGTRGGLGCIRGSSRRECPRDTRRTRRAPGCGLRVKHSGTGGVLGDIRRKSPGWVLGTRVALASFRGKYHSLVFAAHSGASGRVAAHSEASGEACGALGGFRGWLSAGASALG